MTTRREILKAQPAAQRLAGERYVLANEGGRVAVQLFGLEWRPGFTASVLARTASSPRRSGRAKHHVRATTKNSTAHARRWSRLREWLGR